MSERVNRRELILETASQLFMENGYHATSVRQIADVVGCTEAALYYHFKEGKRALLQAVLESEFPNLLTLVENCYGAQSLADLMQRFAETMEQLARPRIAKMRWLTAAFPYLTPEEQALFHEKHMALLNTLTGLVEQFLPAEQARRSALMFFCMTFGYGQLFWNLGLEQQVEFSPHDLINTLMDLMTVTNAQVKEA